MCDKIVSIRRGREELLSSCLRGKCYLDTWLGSWANMSLENHSARKKRLEKHKTTPQGAFEWQARRGKSCICLLVRISIWGDVSLKHEDTYSGVSTLNWHLISLKQKTERKNNLKWQNDHPHSCPGNWCSHTWDRLWFITMSMSHKAL